MRGGRSGWFAGPQGQPAAAGAGPGRPLCAGALLLILGAEQAPLLLRSCHCSSPLLAAGPPRFVGLCGFREKACVMISVLPNLEKAELRIS